MNEAHFPSYEEAMAHPKLLSVEWKFSPTDAERANAMACYYCRMLWGDDINHPTTYRLGAYLFDGDDPTNISRKIDALKDALHLNVAHLGWMGTNDLTALRKELGEEAFNKKFDEAFGLCDEAKGVA